MKLSLPRQRRGLLLVLLLALVLVVGVGPFLPLAGSLGSGRFGDVPLYRVQRQAFERRVPAQGELRAVRATPINVPSDAPGPFRIAWLAPDGSRVKAGEVVVRFDSSEIEKTLINAEADLASARWRSQKQRVHGSAQVEKLERDLQLARMELDNARQFQKKDAQIFSRNDIIESEIDSDLAQHRERHAREARRTEESLSSSELQLIAIDMRQAELKIQQARQALTALAVTAPHDGVLVMNRDWRGTPTRVGDSVWNGQPLAQLPDLSTMEAEVFVLEADAGGLEAGKPATVVVESAPGVSYQAKIRRVEALAKPRLRGSPVQYFAVTLALDRTDPRVMKPGQRVRANLLLEERQGALTVPRQAVFQSEGRTVVHRKKGDGFEAVEVKLGSSGAGRVVVESGIGEGDLLALVDPARPVGEDATAEEEASPTPGRPSAPVAPGGAR
ncbi:MAG TPA: efflux RND transporter periplasmic adaptor subunit [Thermoanaerobaculia bacterium]|nr:efflux RND transporter periplasmic adaptor subunit [Thermoanaerobaculia bacterium]